MSENLTRIIDAFQGRKILVIGDMVADVYLDGRISRISREAPVLVLQQAGERIVAGGAANVVNNIATLGGEVYAVGVVGDDHAAAGIETISKTRIIAGGRATVSQQIVRIDKQSEAPLDEEVEQQLQDYIETLLPGIEGVVISDYGAGTVTPRLQAQLIDYCREHDIPSMVDSRYEIRRFQRIGYVKQNDAELAAAVGRTLPDTAAIHAAGRELLAAMQADGVLVTRGEYPRVRPQ